MNQGPGSRLPQRPPTAAHREEADREEEAELTTEQLGELKARLDERRAALVASIEGRQSEERDGPGREVGDEMDEATLEGALGMSSKLLERDVRILREIDRALAKMRDGTYGLCEGTGEPIGYERLRHAPWARYGIAYQEELEREARTRGQ
jgi:DnaK suppressor protein